jgi:mRNA-binding protein PUF3
MNASVGPAPNNAASASASASAKGKAADIQPRSVNTSPNRTREGGVSNGSAFYENGSAAVGARAAGYANGNFQDESNGFAGPLRQQKRNLQEQSLIDSMNSFALARDHSVPPSRQSQGSPSSGDHLYRGHTPSNSISQRPMHQHSASLSNSHARDMNQHAFAMNGHITEDLQIGYGRRAGRDNGTRGFNPSTQPFHPNQGSAVSWSTGSDISASRINGAPDFNTDVLSGQHSNARRQVGDLSSPAPNYRVELQNGQRSYAPSPEPWMDGPVSRESRAAEDRRTSSMYGANFQHQPQQPWYPAGQFQFPSMQPQYPASYMESPYGVRHVNPLYAPTQNVPGGFPLPGPMSGIRPGRDQDVPRRSALLEEYRGSTKHNKKFELKDIYGHIVEFSGDQHGSRFIQSKLGIANSDEKERVFDELRPNAIQLMKDVFGNYVVQKLFEHGSQVQKKFLADMMRGRVVELSVQSYACRVVQKALEHILVEQQAELVKELQPEIIRVIKCSNGNHVVQKIIELVPREHFDFIMDAMRGQIATLSAHQYGCRVIQRMLEHGTEADKADIMAELHPSLQILITDQYGNYVAQHVLTNGKAEDRARLIQLVLGQLENLSKHKFASNVVEKCIVHGSPEQRRSIRTQLTAAGSDGTSPLPLMMRDQYANYVIQKLLVMLPEDERDMLKEEIKPHLDILRKANASRQLTALEKLLASSETEAPESARSNGVSNDANSAAPTPVLTNETNSPQSSSPSSSHVSAVDALASRDTKKSAAETVDAVDPQVEGEAQ